MPTRPRSTVVFLYKMDLDNLLMVNGRRLYVEQCGSAEGEVVVFLHHGLGSTYSWKLQMPAFAKAGFRVIVYDRWGYGKSDPRPSLSVPDFRDDLEDLVALLDQLRMGKVTLVGHSDGGTISLYFALQNPHKVNRLVTIAAHIYVEPKMLPGIEGLRISFASDGRFREGLRRLHGEKTQAVFYNWYSGWVKPEHLTWDMRPLLAGITRPVLVVQGEADEHATPQHAKDIAASIPGAELWLEPGAGHMLPQEMSEEFNRRTLEFINLGSSSQKEARKPGK